MTNKPKRTFADQDVQRIADIWRRIGAFQTLKESALPPTAKGAWIFEAADRELQKLYAELEAFFAETEAP